ncbi:MAG: choice-of-anchor Q domain-containing protein [Oscillochloridaceae bacterium]|nr:hypothetical protein [Chloroflexaceae bacterium]MDW8391937.1 choice-of-anchor Q domain-containing protein [Oscillochloridaceae bacterium]
MVHPTLRRFTLTLIALLVLATPPTLPARAAPKIVGDGTPGSCTEASLRAALAGGGSVSFNCGGAPVTITVSAPFEITAPETTIDGGGLITLRGQNSRIIAHRTTGAQGSSVLTLRNLTITGGRAGGANDAANGGAVASVFGAANPAFKPALVVENVTFEDNDSTVTSLTRGDAYDYGGGAIYSQGGSVTVRNCRFIGNDANNGAGGAIHVLQSGLVIEDSEFRNNSAIGARPQDSLGGAIYIDGLGGENGLFRVARSIFASNHAYNSGGAIYVNMYENSSRTEVLDSAFVENAVIGGERAQGGAIGGGGSSLGGATGNPAIVIERSLFSANSVRRTPGAGGNPNEDGSGGALAFPQRARLRIVNSTFEGNRAAGAGFNANGGALYVVNHSDPFEIVNSTFANNTAGWVGGAISNSQINGQPGGRVRNTLFVNNTADNGPNDWNIQQHCSSELAHDGRSLQFPPRLTGGNFFNDVTCFQGKSAPGQTGDPQFRNPQLQALADNGGPTRTMAITAASPAFNAGADCPPTDQRGVARPQGAACDLGAFEAVLALSVAPGLIGVNAANPTLNVLGDGFSPGSVVQINGADRPTTFISALELRVALAPADVAAPGTLRVSVRGPGENLGSAEVRVAEEVRRVHLPLVRR